MAGAQDELDAFRDFEQSGWNETATLYDSHFGRHTLNYVDDLLDAANVGSAMSVLDVACGPGYVSASAHRRGARTTGVDFAPNMVAEARRLQQGPDFEVADAEQLPYADEAFDAVVMGFGMLHMARPEAVTAEIARVLRPGGRFAFSVWGDPETRMLGLGIVIRAMTTHANLDLGLPEGPPMFRLGEHAESEALLRGVGFTDIQIRDIDKRWRVEEATTLFTAFKDAGVRAGVALRQQTPEAIEKMVADIRRDSAPFAVGDHYEFLMGAVVAAGTKP